MVIINEKLIDHRIYDEHIITDGDDIRVISSPSVGG
jgi:sulfur carrier protein ThiS